MEAILQDTARHDPDGIDALPVGAPIGGYAVRRIIGHGGFGITYEAHNRVTGKGVAIKEFFPASMVRRDGTALIYSRANEETITWALRKFEETTTTLCGLAHQNIVQVHDYVPANGTGYMIMELLEGETLEHWLRARPAPPSLEALRPIVEPVMEALAYVHEQGLVHRDIAPDNILITREGRPVLIDFGSVSRDLSDAGQNGMSGTVGVVKRHYTAPEQMRAKARPTPEADIYSMGAVLYRALCGEKPVDGQDRVDAIFHGQSADPYAPMTARLPPGCPAGAAQAVDTALAVRPEGRFRKIADMRAALAPGPAPAVSAVPVAPRIPAWWLAAAALAVVLAALGGAFAGSRWAPDDGASRAIRDDQRDAALERARADVEQQRKDAQQAKADLAKESQALQAGQAQLAADRAQLTADRSRLDQRGQAANGDAGRLAKQLSETQAQADAAERSRATAEAEAAQLRGQVQADASEIDRVRAELRDKSTVVGLLTAENARLQRAARQEAPPRRSEPDEPQARSTPYSYPVNTAPDGWAALKAGPDASSRRLAKVYDGTLFLVVGEAPGWKRVRLQSGETGWIASRLIGCCRPSP